MSTLTEPVVGPITICLDYSTPKGEVIPLHRNKFLSVYYDGYHHFVRFNKYAEGVVAVARYRNGDFAMVELERSPRFGLSLELVRGGVEPGESTADAAKRECLEETGHAANIVACLGPIGADTATIDAVNTAYLLEILNDIPDAPFDEQEVRRPVRVSPDELIQKIARGDIKCGITLAALLKALAYAGFAAA